MDEFFVAHMRFMILSADAERPRAVLLSAKAASQGRIACVYLTSSPREAVRARLLLARSNVRVHCAAGLQEALQLLEAVDAKVLLVDYSFPEGAWSDAIKGVSERCPETAVIVAVPTRLATAWEDIIPAGGYEVVLKPFALDEVGPIVLNADRYAREFLSDSAREARTKAVLAAIRSVAGENPRQGPPNPRDLKDEGAGPIRSLARKAAGFCQDAIAFLK